MGHYQKTMKINDFEDFAKIMADTMEHYEKQWKSMIFVKIMADTMGHYGILSKNYENQWFWGFF